MPERSPYEDLARGALLEITPASTVGEYVGSTDEGDGIVSLLFASAMPGYPDWTWTVSVAHVEGDEPTVMEAELMPAEGALLAPDWVPWSDRLAEYKAAQENAPGDDESDDDDSEDDDESLEDDDSEDDDDEELDEDDVLGNDVLHGGDLDGVDIDDADIDSDDDDSDNDDSDDDDSEDDDDFDDDSDAEGPDRTY
jgi:hypothetical protein